MAFIDTQNEFSDAQAVTSTAISTNVIDLFAGTGAGTALTGESTMDIGQASAGQLYLVVSTVAAATDVSSDATLTVSLESDSTANLATSATVHFSTGALAFAAFSPAGTRLVTIPLPHGNYERYLGVRYTVANGPLTAGTFDAYLTPSPAGVRRTYQTAFVVQ